MEQNNQLEPLKLSPELVSEAKIRALFNTQLIKKGYPKLLQGLENLSFSKDSLQPSYPELKAVDTFLKDLEEIRLELSKPYGDVPRLIKKVFDEVTAPISTLSVSKKADLKAANELAAAELKKAQQENARVENIKSAIGNFINLITREISLAEDDTTIVAIQKKIGAEKSRTGFYAEFIGELREKCDALTPAINTRKESIRKYQDLAKEQEQAIKDNDPVKAAQIKGEMEYVDAALTDNTIRLQEKAFEQAVSIETYVAEPLINVAKAKTRRWLWRVDDINLLYKKMPHLVKLVPDEEAINTILKTKRADGSFKGKEEEAMNGITFYLEKYY